MKKLLFQILLFVNCFLANTQCLLSDSVIDRIVNDYFTNGQCTGTICTISVTKKIDTTFYEITTLGSLRRLNNFKITNIRIISDSYVLIHDHSCSNTGFVADDKIMYEKLKKYCFDDVSTTIENGLEIVKGKAFDPSWFIWTEVNGCLIGKIILNP